MNLVLPEQIKLKMLLYKYMKQLEPLVSSSKCERQHKVSDWLEPCMHAFYAHIDGLEVSESVEGGEGG